MVCRLFANVSELFASYLVKMKFQSWTYFSEVFMGVDSSIDRSKPVRGAFYRGSHLFNPLAKFMHVPLDQINFVICSLVTFVIGQFMRHKLPPKLYSARVRALVETLFGLLLLSFCFGNQLRVLLLQSSVAYLIMICFPSNQLMAILVTLWSLFYMTLVHLCRLQYDYGGYTMDISGPVMVQTQRLTSLAFNLVDGSSLLNQSDQKNEIRSDNGDTMTNGKVVTNGSTKMAKTTMYFKHKIAWSNKQYQMPESHIKHAVKQVPGFIEFFSYTLYFHGSIVGPFIFFTEYTDYLNGYDQKDLPPMNVPYLIYLFVRSFGCGILSAYMSPYIPFEFVLTNEYMVSLAILLFNSMLFIKFYN